MGSTRDNTFPDPLYSTENADWKHTQERQNILGKKTTCFKKNRQIGASVTNQLFRQQV